MPGGRAGEVSYLAAHPNKRKGTFKSIFDGDSECGDRKDVVIVHRKWHRPEERSLPERFFRFDFYCDTLQVSILYA